MYNTCPNLTLAMQLFPNSPSFPNFHHLTAFHYPSHSTAEAETCIPRRILWAQPCLQHLVRRTPHPQRATIQHMRVNHRCSQIRMSHQFLNRPNVGSVLQHVRRKRMAK